MLREETPSASAMGDSNEVLAHGGVPAQAFKL